ncbi:RHS repeat domain-containing protein [Paenibacillus mesotrionivorans]|uniref:RHS repeat domain-containing protein n=1 Tax=Paenibacillus mesotrionivorans TaxID=3160968 RepID=A0ACC7P4R4_9BACL
MNKFLRFFSTFLFLLCISIGLSAYAHAAVYGDDNVINGLFTQESINQTNKSQYADRSGSENIDEVTGSLTWKSNQIQLPGIEGLDLSIGVMYQSNYAFGYMRHYNSSGQIKKYNYLISRYDLGQGWSFRFPSVQLADGYTYYHTGEGPIYRVDFGATGAVESYTHLLGYQGKDVQFLADAQGTFSNGQATSAFYVEYDSKKREYFAADGRLLGIVDRYGNTLTFQHQDRVTYDGQTNNVISSIKDSVGRTISFTYTTNLQTVTDEEFSNANGEKITVTVNDPSGNFVESVIYTKWRQPMKFNENPDGYAPYLWSIKNQNSEYTYFEYETKVGRFDHRYKSYDYSGWNSYFLLNEISADRTRFKYQHELTNRNLGPSGISEDFRVTQRYTQLVKSTGATGDYNHLNYTYTNDYSGYPGYSNPYDLPASYTFSSQSKLQSNTRTNGLTSISTYNGKQQPTVKETRTSAVSRKFTSYLAFHSTFTQLPTDLQITEYDIGDTDATASKLFVAKTYTDWGAVATETKPLIRSEMDNPRTKSQYSTTFIYEPNYHQVESKKLYQNYDKQLIDSYTYDGNGRLRTHINPKGEVTTTWYETIDSNGNVMDNSTQASTVLKGKVRKVVTSKPIEDGKASQSITRYSAETQYAFPSEVTTTFTTSDSNGQPLVQTIKKSMSYNLGTGLLQEESDGNNNKTAYTYDVLGRVLSVKYPEFTNNSGERYAVSDIYEYGVINDTTLVMDDPENSSLRELRLYSYRKYTRLSNNTLTKLNQAYSYYDGMGNVRKISQHDPQTNTFKDTRYHYDDQGRVAYVRDAMENISMAAYDMWGNQDEVIDAFGNLYKTERQLKPIRRITGYFVAAADMEDYRSDPTRLDLKSQYVERDFDLWGQLRFVRTFKDWPNRSQPITEEYVYDIAGNISSYLDPNNNISDFGKTKNYYYDALNRVISIRDALGQYTNIEYNALGKIKRMYMERGGESVQLNTKQYNEIGGLQSKADPTGATETYTYNNLGQLIGSKDRMGATTASLYDTQGRMISNLTVRDSINQEIKTNIGSDGILFDTTEIFLNGLNTSKITTGMDTNKRVSSINQTANNYRSSLNLTYNGINQITKQVNGVAGFTVNFQYNRNRLDKVQVNGQNIVDNSDQANVRYTYYPNGQVDTITYPPLLDGSIVSSKYTYDAQGRIKTLVNSKGGSSLSSYTYDYDFNGNITSINEDTLLGNRSSTYTYDKLNRLEGITRSDGSTSRYTYDLLGNRKTQEDTRSLLFSMEDNVNNYDIYNRLVDVAKGDTTTSLAYSADGLRYKKTNGGETIQYQYNALAQVIAESNGNNATEANYVRGDRLLVKKEAATGKSYYYLYNGHGDVNMMIDTNGVVVNQYQYDEWGNLLINEETVPNSFKYAGEIYDAESGLYYLRARYYDPSVGRFINQDMYEGDITNPLSLNLYTYVHNNPLIYSDPTGNWCTSADGKYSLPGGCNGGIEGQKDVEKDVGTSKYSKDSNHNDSWIIWNGVRMEKYEYTSSKENVTVEIAIETGKGAADAALGKPLSDAINNLNKGTAARIPYTHAGPYSGTAMKYTPPLKSVSFASTAIKVAGPIALGSYVYHIGEDINKYEGSDLFYATIITTLSDGVSVGAGMMIAAAGAAAVAAGAEVIIAGGLVIVAGGVAGYLIGEVGDWIKGTFVK